MKSWKTTLTGIIGGVLINAGTMIENGGHFDPKALLLGAVIALLGALSKDHDSSGGATTA